MENLVAYITLQVHDPDGRRRFYRKYRSKSFVRNFLRMFFGLTSPSLAISTWTIKDTGDTDRSAVTTNRDQGNNATQKMQIQIGSSGTDPTVLDNKIGTTIAGPTDCSSVFDDSSGDNIAYRFQIVFTNTSGSAWTVREATMETLIEYSGTASIRVVFIRDEFGSPITVNDGQSITVEYTLKTTV